VPAPSSRPQRRFLPNCILTRMEDTPHTLQDTLVISAEMARPSAAVPANPGAYSYIATDADGTGHWGTVNAAFLRSGLRATT
jgi:hypothetical protein